MLQAMSAVANNGKMVKPYLVRSKELLTQNNGKTVFSQITNCDRKTNQSSTAKEVREMMQDVVTDKDGTGTASQDRWL